MDNLTKRITLDIWTSYVTAQNIKIMEDNNILPIFIARNISNSTLIGGWQGTAVHFGQLAPSPILLRQWKGGEISNEHFQERYGEELSELDFFEIFKKMKTLLVASGASGLVLMGYGKEKEKDHRWYLSEYINATEILEKRIKELVI